MSDYLSIISELTNPKRFSLLRILREDSYSIAELSKRINLSKSEISRHLSRLMEIGAVEKEITSRKYKPATLGENLLPLFSPIEFVTRHVNYFRCHFIDLPIHLTRKIDALMDSELIRGIGNIMFKIQENFEQATDEIFIMSDQAFPWTIKGKIRSGNFIIPSSMRFEGESVRHLHEKQQGRILNALSHALLISDNKRGMIAFPGIDNKPDYKEGFIVTDSVGIDYLKSIWHYFWDIAEKIG